MNPGTYSMHATNFLRPILSWLNVLAEPYLNVVSTLSIVKVTMADLPTE